MSARFFLERNWIGNAGWSIVEFQPGCAFPYRHGPFPTFDVAFDQACMRFGPMALSLTPQLEMKALELGSAS